MKNQLLHLQALKVICNNQSGVWRSWLACQHGVLVVVRSSRITPTYKKRVTT